MNRDKVTLSFTALIALTVGTVAGVAFTSEDGTTQEVAVSIDDIQRIGRDHAEAQRKAAQDAGDDWLRQSWLIERRLFESIISLRELRSLYRGETTTPDPDPGDGSDDDPDDDPGPADDSPDYISVMPADTPVGGTSTIGHQLTSEGKYVVFASARMQGNQRAVLHIQDAETWLVIEGTNMAAEPESPVSDYQMQIWPRLVAGRTYQAQVWVVTTLDNGTTVKGPQRSETISIPLDNP